MIRRLLVSSLLALALGGGAVAPLTAQDAPAAAGQSPEWVALHDALTEARRHHLRRVAVWGAVSFAAGVALAWSAGDGGATRRGFGIQSAAWGAINLGIAGWGFAAGPPDAAAGLVEALAAEDGWSHLLLVNLGLNVGYVAVGSTLWILSHRGVRSARALRGHGIAVVAQGLGLLALDALAWSSSSDRLDALRGAVARLEVGAGAVPDAVRVGLSIPLGG